MDTPWLRPPFIPVRDNPHALRLWEEGEGACCEEFTRHAQPLDGALVVDVGAGYGYATRMLFGAWPGAEVVAVDYQSYEVEPGDCYPGELRLGDAHALPVSDEAAEALWSAHCLEHLRSPIDALLDWWRVLVPGGAVGVGVPSYGDVQSGHLWDLSDPRRLWYLLRLTGFTTERIVRSGNTLLALAHKASIPDSVFLEVLGVPDEVEVVAL